MALFIILGRAFKIPFASSDITSIAVDIISGALSEMKAVSLSSNSFTAVSILGANALSSPLKTH